MTTREQVRAIADAVLYEGLLLFPYSKNSLKNQARWQFGVLMPQGYADASEPNALRSQMVVTPQAQPGNGTITVLLRFLQSQEMPIEREVERTAQLCAGRVELPFDVDVLRGAIVLDMVPDGDTLGLTLEVHNLGTISATADRNEALRMALINAHALLTADGGVFASLLDPPAVATAAASHCVNERVFPVLVGEPADADKKTAAMMLVSPIILYDFPSIAKASRGHTFDATEIDELLMLSVASLSEREKHEARAAHPYARELVERAEALDADTLASLHGELTGGVREPGDETVVIAGVPVRRGTPVRVHPKGRADVWDDFVNGMRGRVCAVHTDFDGKRYVGVVFDGDPAGDLHEWYGRSFFYGTEEIEPLSERDDAHEDAHSRNR
jgi:hypothetical protein